MTTEQTYFCNVCKDPIDNLTGVGFSFKSANTEFEEGFAAHHENHLCYKCIAAIYDLSVRIQSEKKRLNQEYLGLTRT
jgi:hypothetical protein